MQRLTLINSNGQRVVLGNSGPFMVTQINGLDAPPVDIQTQKSPYQDGVTYIDNTLEPRQISIEGAILQKDKARVFELRRELLSVANPKLGACRLLYEYDGGVKEVECVVDGSPAFPDKQMDIYQKFLINLFCPNPFWLDTATTTEEIVTWLGGMTFPLKLPSAFASKGPKIINIINIGEAETPVRVEFKGPATNPKVVNHTTGEYIQINRVLLAGDVLVITTDFGGKRVEINGENVFNWIDLSSSFWQLQVGDNVIEYTSDDELESAAVSISYRNRYVGI